MRTLSVNLSHDASVTLIEDGKIILHQLEERLSHKKHDQFVYHCIDTIKEYCDNIDRLVYSGCWNAISSNRHVLLQYLRYKGYKLPDVDIEVVIDGDRHHHWFHALCGYFSSPFDKDAAILVMDGAGSDLSSKSKENESIFILEDGNMNCVYKTIGGFRNNKDEYLDFPTRIGVGMMYNAVTGRIGFKNYDEGKTMGLASYTHNSDHLPEFINIKEGANESIFGQLITGNIPGTESIISASFVAGLNNDFYNREEKNIIGSPSFQFDSLLAHIAQKDFEDYVYNMVLKTIDITKRKNIVLSGGCFMNCVSNYKLIKRLPKDVNIYVDPLCNDVGISIGGSMYSEFMDYTSDDYLKNTFLTKKTLKKYIPSYLGSSLKYEYSLKSQYTEKDTTPQEVANLLSCGNIVAIAQGKAESGARALGNRSILFNPTIKNGRDIVNKVKKREPWRPFAGTVMLEHAREWFDMDKLEESSFMTYAIDVIEDKKEIIPSITHVDGTCRIQTVTENQNKNYYNLISEFYKITNIPIVLNTSFNLAGDTIVETMQDAIDTLEKSEIEYLYLPDIMKLICVPNK